VSVSPAGKKTVLVVHYLGPVRTIMYIVRTHF